jgi:transposase-like protein
LDDLKTMSYCTVGRRYGISDNAVRKWIRWYEYNGEAEARASGDASQDEPPDTIAA